MAQVIITDQRVVSAGWAAWGRTVAIGAVTGIIFWLLTLLIAHYVVEPLTCRQIVDASMCTNATPLAGTIATILAAVIAIGLMIRLRIARPIITAVATAALLWNLASWTAGLFWLEALGWSVLLYLLTFALFGWITRYITLWVTIVLSLLIVVVLRIALIL